MSGKHILLAEDDPHIRLSLSIILRKAGYEVTTAEDGQDALEKIIGLKNTHNSADLLLTDIQMPGISGMELIDELEKMDIQVPVLVITGYGDKQTVVDLMRRGCADYIDKPFEPQNLLERLPLIFKKTEKVRMEKEKQTVQLVHEKAELDRQVRSYMHNFEKLREQVDSAVGAYQNLTHIREKSYKVSVAYRHQPLSDLGGDFMDIRNTPTGCDILMADVAGHDMGASYHTVLIKAFFDENCRTGNDGRSFFRLLNNQLLENGKNERMVTAIFLRLNLKMMQGEVVSAGHPPLIRFLKEIPIPDRVMAIGDVLGIHENVSFQAKTFPLSPGDQFFLYTDGLTSAYRPDVHTRKKEKLGTDGLEYLIKKHCRLSLDNMIGNIEKAITETHGYKFNDDMLILGVKIP